MKPVSESASIVILGAFNPAIFQPAWLAAKNLISANDALTAEVRLISSQFAAFKAGGIILEVLPDRFLVQADEPLDQVRLRDLVIGIFAVLSETPVTRMGVNWTQVFRLESEQKWHGTGDLLAPKDVWSKVLRGRPGLKAITVQGALPEGLRGQLNVKIEPIAPAVPNGVRFEFNNDINGPDRDGPVSVDAFIEIIQTWWEKWRNESAHIANELLTLTGAT